MRRGDRGEEVRELQAKLNRIGESLAEDGGFGEKTEAAVVRWEAANGRPADGIVDSYDLADISREAAEEAARAAHDLAGQRMEPSPAVWSRLSAALEIATDGGWGRAVESGKPAGAGPRAAVYGPGRGLWLSAEAAELAEARGQIAPVKRGPEGGVWVMTCGPGALGLPARLRNGQRRPTFHCSSFTSWIAGIIVGLDGSWTHTGNMPSLESLLTKRGPFVHPGSTPVRVYGMGDYFGAVAPDGSTAQRHKLRGRAASRYMDTLELWDRLPELPGILFFGQSTKRRDGSWTWEHHTGLLVEHPAWKDRWFRLAADGSKAHGFYSGTPIDVEVIDRAEALALKSSRYFYAHAPIYVEHTGPGCPITRETL